MFTDSTSLMSLRNARHQLQSLGLIDEPTGLPGRDLVLVQLDQAIALAKRDKRSVGVLSLKVDGFRQLRETEDGQVADEVIQQFATRITAFVRGSDVPARVSNDSFLVVLTALTSSNDTVIVAVRLLLVLAEPVRRCRKGSLRSLQHRRRGVPSRRGGRDISVWGSSRGCRPRTADGRRTIPRCPGEPRGQEESS